MVRPTMLYLFLTFGIWGLCKKLQTYPKSDKRYFVGYTKMLVFLPHYTEANSFAAKCCAFKENGSFKKVSGRIVQLDEINSIFVIRSKERDLGSNSRVSYSDWYGSLYNKMYELRSNLQLNHVGKARANLSSAQTRYFCWTTVYLRYTRKRWWALTPELAKCQYNPS